MEIEHDVTLYSVFEDVSIATALDQINANSSRIIFTLDVEGRLTGVMSDGDLRRWLMANRKIDTSQPISAVAKKAVVSGRISGTPEEWQRLLSEPVQIIPLVDAAGHLHAIVRPRKPDIRIGKNKVGVNAPVFVIAEIGNNHNGSTDHAKLLVDAAAAAGADCAKFQMRQLATVYRNSNGGTKPTEDLGVEYTLDLLKRYALSNDDLFRIFDYCHTKGIEPLCTPWDADSVATLESYGMNGYKAASPDLTNHDLLRRIAATRRPMIVSTGMSSEAEIRESVMILNQSGASYALLHCNSTYPAPARDINLAYMERLREIGQCPVGYSGHERGINIAIAAVARGARIIEKHFTLDRSLEGSDHKFSLLPDELADLVAGIRETERAIGDASPRMVSQGELLNRSNLAKSLIAKCDIRPGEIITADMLDVKSPGQGLQPNNRKILIGQRAKHGVPAGQFIFPRDIDNNLPPVRRYSFNRPWGIPVRYHDWRTLTASSNPDFVEFHLSYRDMDVDFREYLDEKCDLRLVVHCPELFADDHILDLCSPSERYRQRSIQETQRVIDLTRDLAFRFKNTDRPPLVINLGGFSECGHLNERETARRYEQLHRSLDALDTTGIELLPQTMPPFPWHFGGQRFHNVLVEPHDIRHLCEERKLRVCLDVSHAMLACAELGMPLDEYVELIAPHIAHLHIADASGTDREGQQIGDGQVNFILLARQLRKLAPDAGFIPEIWQGHVGEGQGFWTALERLEPVFGAAESADTGSTLRPAYRNAKQRRSLRETRGPRSRTY